MPRQSCWSPDFPRTRRSSWLHQIGHQPERAGDQPVELVVQVEAGMGVPALADPGRDERTFERGFAGVVHGEQRLVSVIPNRGEVETAFLVPAGEILDGNPVRPR